MKTRELLGLKIKEYRKKCHLTQEQLGEMIGRDSGYISKIEVGRNFPSLSTLEKISDVLKIDLFQLFEFSKTESVDFKSEIIEIYEKLNKEKRYTLYRVAKDLL